MSDLKYRLYGFAHHTAKKLIGRDNLTVGNILSSASIKMGGGTCRYCLFVLGWLCG